MAATFETSLAPQSVTFAAAGETESVSFDAGAGSNRLLLVPVGWRDRNNALSEVRYAGIQMAPAVAKFAFGPIYALQVWLLAGPASGTNFIAVTMGAGDADSAAVIGAWVAHTVDQATPADTAVTNDTSGSTAAATCNVTVPSAADDRVFVVNFGAVPDEGVGVTATPTNYTEREDGSNGVYSMEFGDAAGATSIAASVVYNNTLAVPWNFGAIGINVNAASGGAAPQRIFYRRRRYFDLGKWSSPLIARPTDADVRLVAQTKRAA